MLKKYHSNIGFTLIELLIVIALLGALAVAMIAAIDPLEQFKRGQDTGTRNTAEEIYNSAIRYYSLKARFPWTTAITTQSASSLSTYFSDLIRAGEMKTDFVQIAGTRLGSIFITASSDFVYVCYQPASKGLQEDPNTKYGQGGAVTTGCRSMTSTGTSCYWCLK